MHKFKVFLKHIPPRIHLYSSPSIPLLMFSQNRRNRAPVAPKTSHKNKFKYSLLSNIIPFVSLLGIDDKSEENSIDSDSVVTEVTKTDVEENIAHLLTLARVALEHGDVDKAEAILNMGIKISEDNNVFIGMPFMYDILATLAFGQGNVEKAETLLVHAIEKLVQIGMPENEHHVIDFKLRLARIYSALRQRELAEIGFKTCLAAQEKKVLNGDHSTRTGMLFVNVLFWYGVHKIRNAQYDGAKRLLDNAYDYAIRIKGLSPYQEMVILYTLADINLELGEYDPALRKMQNAIALGKGISSVDLPKCYVKLSKIYLKLGIVNHAKMAAEESVKLAGIFNNKEVLEEANEVLAEIETIEKN